VKRITLWAVAALAALAMTAVVGAVSASAATVLCSEAESVCAEKNVLPAGEGLPLAVAKPDGYGKFMIRGGVGGVECNYAVINSTSTAEAGNPLPGQSTFGVNAKNCATWQWHEKSQPCKAVTFNNPKETLKATGNGAGTINIGSASEPLTVSFTCYTPLLEEVVECSYKANSAVPVHYDGYEATILKTEATTSLVSGSEWCTSTGSLDAELVKDAGPFISTRPSTVLCSKAESVCASGNVLPAGAGVALGKDPLGGKFLIKAGLGAVKCNYAVISSLSTAETGTPLLPGQSQVGVLPKNCLPSLFGTASCESMTFNNPKETFEATGGGSGVINLGSKSEPLTVSYACLTTLSEEPVKCSYQAKSSIPIHYNGYDGTIKSTESALTLVSSNGYCGSTGSLEAELVNGSGVERFISTIY
jgi:hypothetical protein